MNKNLITLKISNPKFKYNKGIKIFFCKILKVNNFNIIYKKLPQSYKNL